jgi:hypothetical protein
MHLLYYHTNCADGYAALCIAHAALLARGIPAAEIEPRPINYGWPNQIPNVIDDSLFVDDHIYYLDYTPPAVDLALLLAELASWAVTIKLTIIDHHEKMAPVHGWSKDEHGQWQQNGSNPSFESIFAFTESGASLTWKHFHPGEPMPDAVTLIARRDLGHAFQTPEDATERGLNKAALALHGALFRLLPRTLDTWSPIIHGQTNLDEVIDAGHMLRSGDQDLIRAAIDFPRWLDFTRLIVSPSQSLPISTSGLKQIPAVNGLGPELVSDACQELLRRYPEAPFAASWWTDAKTGRITYSLRSRPPGHPDGHTNVCEIAKACHPDGGGHACAAGFSSTLPVPLV